MGKIFKTASRTNIEYFFEYLKKEQVFQNFLDPVKEIKRINNFLEPGRSEDLIRQIAESCEFKNLKKADGEIKVHANFTKENMPVMYRKGEVGDWKNYFTVSQNEQMENGWKKT